jgi:hypothetical protein
MYYIVKIHYKIKMSNVDNKQTRYIDNKQTGYTESYLSEYYPFWKHQIYFYEYDIRVIYLGNDYNDKTIQKIYVEHLKKTALDVGGTILVRVSTVSQFDRIFQIHLETYKDQSKNECWILDLEFYKQIWSNSKSLYDNYKINCIIIKNTDKFGIVNI